MDEKEKKENIVNDKIRISLIDTIKAEEEKEEKQIDIQILLLDLFDDILEDRKEQMTPEQIGKIVRLRSKIEIELKEF